MAQKNIVVIGRRGRGKTSLVNLLACGPDWKNQVIPVNHGVDSVETDLTPKQALEPLSDVFLQDTTGFDDTTGEVMIFKELQAVLKHNTIHGVVFVLQSGRLDDWDKTVFMFFLQVILEKVPSSMIGTVFTRSSDDLLEENDFPSYLENQQDGSGRDFLLELQKRVGNKITFIENPDPSISVKKIYDQANQAKREQSHKNLVNLINQFKGSYEVDRLDVLVNSAKQGLKYFERNPFKVSVSVLAVGIGALTVLAAGVIVGGALLTVAAGAVIVTGGAAAAIVAGVSGATVAGLAVADAATVAAVGAVGVAAAAGTAGVAAEVGTRIGSFFMKKGEKEMKEMASQAEEIPIPI